MLSTFLGIVVVGFAVLIAFALTVMIRFFSYCDKVAKSDGRVIERATPWGHIDKGLNSFERELYGGLISGEYIKSKDDSVIELGRGLARDFKLIKIIAVVLLGLAIVWDLARRGVLM